MSQPDLPADPTDLIDPIEPIDPTSLAPRSPHSANSYPAIFRTVQRFNWTVFALFAALLAVVTARHEMFHDELQAFLIVRDSPTLAALFHNLRYEGHPVLWYLLLWIPAHLSWNPVSMQVVNYLLALLEGWLILSARQVDWRIRTLAAFSFFVFYGYGAVARNYMLATLMLTAASFCFLTPRGLSTSPSESGPHPRQALGIILLALSLQTHFFAIPIAAAIFLWLYCFPDADSLRHPGRLFRSLQFWIALALQLASLAIVYVTIRPAADIFTPGYLSTRESPFGYFLIALGRAWQAFFPVPGSFLPHNLLEILVPRHHPSLPAAILSLAIFLAIAATLRNRRSQSFFLCAAFLDLVAFSVTVHYPPVRHYGLIFTALIIAILLDASMDSQPPVVIRSAAKDLLVRSEPRVPPVSNLRPGTERYSTLKQSLLIAFLSIQVLAGLAAAALDVLRPYSEARDAARWLQQNNLASRPMVLQPDYAGVGLLGYLERPNAYYTTCRCFQSFLVWNTNRDESRTLTQSDIDAAQQQARSRSTYDSGSALVITNAPLPADTQQSLHLSLIQAFDHHPIYPDERYFIYQVQNP